MCNYYLDIEEIASMNNCNRQEVIRIIDFDSKKFEDFIFDGLLKIEKFKLSVFEKGDYLQEISQ